MKNALKILTCLAAGMALSGCQSFVSSLSLAPKSGQVQTARADLGSAQDLENGRAALREGHIALAIKQFRMATLSKDTAPDAFNGLGVAYAKLGRADLAERYFRTAVSLDSSNVKYASNLQRFYNSPLGTSKRALAMREKEAAAMLAKAETAAQEQGLVELPAATKRLGNVTLENAPVRITRTSQRELRIATRGANDVTVRRGAMPAMAVRNPAPVKEEVEETAPEAPVVEAAPAKEKRSTRREITLSGLQTSDKPYPVRISLVKPSTSKAPTAARVAVRRGNTSYPLRIALKPAGK